MRDIEETFEAAFKDPNCPTRALVLMDVTKSDSLNKRSTEDLRYMAKFLASQSSRFGARLGIVAGSSLHYGMMRMGEVYSETSGMTTRVFLEDADALSWLIPETQ